MKMNPMDSFRPEVGAHVYDGLNDRWITLTEDMVEHMEASASERVQEGRRGRKLYDDWDGLMLEGWLPAGESPDQAGTD